MAPSTWYHVRIYSATQGTIQFQINGANSGSITTAPTVNLAPQFIAQTTAGSGSNAMWIDWWAMKMQGLTR